ncbi:MAG: hypothetical protein NC122_05655 [Faecalibacterium sp.]|nr:hypothetical protein [Ruminococcus sp.]MCM1391199.1 hypothetical protein [Ruminococcus sp.]MCM1485673.1 hypothetical protein [Faecalibacterium sp.]
MATIIYTTNAGSSKRYAEMLGEKTGYPVVPLEKSDDVSTDEEIIYIGWVMASALQGLQEARAKFDSIKAICAVGMTSDEKQEAEIKSKNAITEPLFLLEGAFNISNLKGIYKMMMGMMMKMLKSKFKDSDDPQEKKALELFEQGFDFVDEQKLIPVLEFLGIE